MNAPKFFCNDLMANEAYSPYIKTCIQNTLNIDSEIQLFKSNHSTKFIVNNETYTINKAGNDFNIIKEGEITKKSFHINILLCLMALDGLDATEGVIDATSFTNWLPKENGIGYFEFNNEKWFSIRDLNTLIESLESKDHLWKRGTSNANDYMDLLNMQAKGLQTINGINISLLNKTALRLTFINSTGLNSVLNKKRTKNVKDVINNVVNWWKKGNEVIIEDNNNVITFNNKRLRIVDNKISLTDFICIYCDKKDARTNMKYLKNIDNVIEEYKFAGPGQRETPIIAIECLDVIIPQLPNKIGDRNKQELLQLLERYVETKAEPEEVVQLEEQSVQEQFSEVVDEAVIEQTPESVDVEIIFDNTIPEFTGKKIRVTPDKKLSVFDVISVYSGIQNPRRSWTQLMTSFPEVVSTIYNFQFPGRGQKETPVMDLRGILQLIMVLPGKRAAATREKFASVIVRYIGGDLSLIEEIVKNKQAQEALPEDNPLKIEFKQDNEGLLIADKLCKDYNIGHVSYELYTGKQGVYLILCGIHYNKPILKFGETGYNPVERLDHHILKYRDVKDPNFKFIGLPFYFRETIDSRKVEKCFLNKIQCNQLHLGPNYKIGNVTSRELFTCSERYRINDIITIMNETINSITNNAIEPYVKSLKAEYNIEFEREKTKRYEYEMKVRVEEVKLLQKKEETRQYELQIELLKLQRA